MILKQRKKVNGSEKRRIKFGSASSKNPKLDISIVSDEHIADIIILHIDHKWSILYRPY